MGHRNQPQYLHDIAIGQKAQFTFKIDQEKHFAFSQVVEDYSPIHWDPEYYHKTKFGRQIGYGFLVTGLLSRLYGEYLPGGSSICIKQDAKYVKPYFVGDTITVVGEVVGKSESTGFVEIECKMFREGNECIFKGKGTVQVLPIEYQRSQLKKETPLYTFETQTISYKDILERLQEAGIQKGDVVFVHSDIAAFGKLATNNRELLMDNIIWALKDAVGEEGTIIMPAFTYSFCRSKEYDQQYSPSTVGVLTEYFRKQPEVDRTLHPIFSAAIWGKRKKEILNVGPDSFGKDSIFAKLHQLQGKILFLGAPFQSGTYMHYVEQSYNVPYRYFKYFQGTVRSNGRSFSDTARFFVRDLENNVTYSAAKLEQCLLEKGLMKKVKIGAGEILLVDGEALYKEAFSCLQKDINFLRGDK